MKKVRIYGTLGPACGAAETLEKMFAEGMDGIRLNLSHTTLEEAAALVKACRSAARACGAAPELLIDMQGPELRIGALAEPLRLIPGETVGMETIPFPEEVKAELAGKTPGQEILLDDGKLLLRAERTGLRVIRGGLLESRKSVALPGCDIRTPAMTERDREQIRHAKEYGVTALMQPFVRSKEDLIEVRTALKAAGCEDIRLLAKIESMAGIEKLPELIPYCDEIVIARGDLGNAMELWELPAAQKRIAEACRMAGRDFMVVTQMLDSMTHRPVPTRAEVSDIFNAVLDGAASVMVTGETAAGEYPVDAIRYLEKTVREAENFRKEKSETEITALTKGKTEMMNSKSSGSVYITLRERPELKDAAAEWFHSKWRVPKSAYLECMDAYLGGETELGWYLCLDGERIVGGLGVIENDFHDRKDLTPNVCAVYTEEEYRCRGIAGKLLDMAVEDLRSKGITPVYLVTDHTGFYERYGWEFLCMVQGDGEPELTRMYMHG